MIVGVAGASASGKTTVCEHIRKSIKSVACIPLDSFYKGLEVGEDPKTYNFDHPNAFGIQECLQAVKTLKSGQPVRIPIYDFVKHCRKAETRLVEPADIIIIEGILVLYWSELRDLMDLKIYMLTDPDTCLIRRTLRDTKERGRTYQEVFDQYVKFVKPSYKEFVKETRQYADIILPNNTDFSVGMRCIVDRLQSSR